MHSINPKKLRGKQIIVDGKLYPSLSEAARQLNKSRVYLRNQANDPSDRDAYFLPQEEK